MIRAALSDGWQAILRYDDPQYCWEPLEEYVAEQAVLYLRCIR